MEEILKYLETLPKGTKITIPQILQWAKENNIKISFGSLNKMLTNIDARQIAASGNETYQFGADRRKRVKDILKNVTIDKAKRGVPSGHNVSAKNLKKYNKIAQVLFAKGEISSPNYKDIKYLSSDHHKIMARKNRKIITTKDGTLDFFSGREKPLKLNIQKKIKAAFPDADFTKGRYGFDVDSKREKNIRDWIKRGYKHTIKEPLTTKQIADIKERFKNRVPAKDWNFLTKENPKGFIWGLAGTGKGGKYEGMQNSISNYLKGKTWFDRFAPGLNANSQNYLLTSFERIAEHEDKNKVKNRTYNRIKNKDGKIIGFQDNTPTGKGTKYYMVDSGLKGVTPITQHPGYAKGAEIARYVEKMKGMEIGGAKFNDLISESMKTKPPGYGVTPWQRHHIYGTARTGFGGLPGEVMLLTRDQNFEVEKVRRAFERSPTSRYGAPISWAEANKQLKKIGAALDLDGRLAGEIASSEKTITKAAQRAGISSSNINNLIKGLIKEVKGAPTSCQAILRKQTGGIATTCVEAIKRDPVGSANKLATMEATSGALGKVKNAATTFLGMLGRGGVRAAPYAALAAVGAAAEPLVKQFRNDDPSTYLSNPDQQKGMLLSMVEQETPQVDEEILKWQMPAHGAATAAGAIPGAGAVYKQRRAIRPDKLIGPMEKGVGPVRASLGITGVLGKALGASFSPLATAATLPISIAAQRAGGTDYSDIATDPGTWMGPAFMSKGAEMASRGITNPTILKALRLGMSPRTLMLGSRFLGLPGLALSAGLWGYDKWKDRDKDEE